MRSLLAPRFAPRFTMSFAVAMIAIPLAGFAQQPAAQQPAAQPPGAQQPATQQSGIRIDHAWSRAALAGHEGVVYLTITATGAADTLSAVTTPVAATAGLHQSIDDHGVMKMRPVASLPIEPGKPVTLAPGGYHIMLTGLKQPLKEGDSFPVTLSFAKAGQVTATATVARAGATTMPGMDHAGMGGMGNMPMQSGGKQP
jgi:copper(I)-binding protein